MPRSERRFQFRRACSSSRSRMRNRRRSARETVMAQISAANAAKRLNPSAKPTCSRESWVRNARMASRARRARSRSGSAPGLYAPMRTRSSDGRRRPSDCVSARPARDAPAGHRRHQTADRVQHLNRRIPSLCRQGARQHHMPIQQRAHRVHQRVLLVVALHQHRIEGGNRSRAKLPGALDQLPAG